MCVLKQIKVRSLLKSIAISLFLIHCQPRIVRPVFVEFMFLLFLLNS